MDGPDDDLAFWCRSLVVTLVLLVLSVALAIYAFGCVDGTPRHGSDPLPAFSLDSQPPVFLE